MAWAQTTCTPGNSTFVLTGIKGPDYCRSSELAIKWSSLTVIMPADCRYTLQGVTRMDDDYRFPVSFAGQQLPYYDNSSSCISYTHMADPTGYSSGNYPSWYFDYATKYSSIPGSNLTWPDFTLSWIGNAVFMQNTGLPSINAYNTGSNRREFTPGNFTLNQQLGPAAFVFSTFLEKSPADSNWNNSWRVLLQRTADGRIAASWFMDAENIRCAVTSVAAQQWYNAQPEAVSGTCKLFFKVAAGSVLGLSSSSACPPGTFSSQTPSGTSSCNICGQGEALLPNKDGKGSACSSCKGKSFAEGWGATSCKPCQRPYVGCERCANYECWD
ncbi:hypothetical protein OEZ86_012604 [Tetradesmus obliquus]|nr:hypothetical protein OEZ86_012604 [Tetradesmus obliquus]